MSYTQLLQRWDGHRVRRFVLLRPFGPSLEIQPGDEPPPLPAYDAERDLAPRTPQLLLHQLGPEDRQLPLVTGPLAASCNRSGGCCSQYPVIPTTAAEAERALVTLHRQGPWDYPFAAAQAFSPATPDRSDLLSPLINRDGCAFLGAGGCRLHALAGPAAKPATCRRNPLQAIHCGDEIELSQLPQCACAARTVGPAAEDAWPSDPLAGLVTVPAIPPIVLVDERRKLPRASYLKWARALADVLAAPTLVEPASVLDGAGRSLGLPPATLTPAWLAILAARMASEAERLELFLSPSGPQPRGARWVARVATALATRPRVQPVLARGDALVVALAVRAHVLLELPTLAAALCDLTRLVRLAALARALEPADTVDPRLETLTALLYLWTTTRWPVSSEPPSPADPAAPPG